MAILIISLLVSFFACDEDDEDSSDAGDDDDDDSGWSSDVCAWTKTGSTQSNAYSTFPLTDKSGTENDDCIPELPVGADRRALEEIWDAYLGTYTDQDGIQLTFICRPEGGWSIPRPTDDYWCDYSFSVPISIQVAGNDEVWLGHIDQDYPGEDYPYEDYPFTNYQEAFLYYKDSNTSYEADKNVDARVVTWEVRYPEEGQVWTKTD